MHISSISLLALAPVVSMAALSPAKLPKFAARSSLPTSLLYGPGIVPRQDDCSDGQICADVCIPSDAMCCDVTVGIYCDAGDVCTTTDTCCPEGKSCSGVTDNGCDDGMTQCGGGCIPDDAECCDKQLGRYCEDGTTCLTSTTCDLSGEKSKSRGGGDDDDEEDAGTMVHVSFVLIALGAGLAVANNF